MKKFFVVICLLSATLSLTMSMNEQKVIQMIANNHPRSVDEFIEYYEPCTLLLSGACSKILAVGNDLLKQIELLNRAFNASEQKIKQD